MMDPSKRRNGEAVPPSLKPAEVLSRVDDDGVLIRFQLAPAEEVVRAELAVPGFEAQVGDRVLVAGEAGELYVVGVLGEARRRPLTMALAEGHLRATHREGIVTLEADGPLEIHSPGGLQLGGPTVHVDCDEARIDARGVRVEAGRFELQAERIFERAESTYRHADDLAQLTAKRARTSVEQTFELTAGRTVIGSQDDTVIDGKRVLLG